MDSKQIITVIRTLIQAELKKSLKPFLRESLKPLLQEMVNNKVNEILAEKYVQTMNKPMISEQRVASAPAARQIESSRIEELKRKYQSENSPLGSLMDDMEDHELRAAMAHQPGALPGMAPDDDDEGVPLDMITGLMRK